MALAHALLLLLLTLLLPQTTFQEEQQGKLSAGDLAALAAVKSSLTEFPRRSTSFFSTWVFNSSPDPCSSFTGIVCSLFDSSTSRVTSLTLGTGLADSARLAGSLSPAISNLTELTQLILSPGIVTGPLPPQLGNLVNLRILSLTRNRFTGAIPSTLSSLRGLHTLDLSYNQLTGSVPPGLPSLPQLKVLILASNQLSGQFPDETADLLHIDLKKNQFTGNLPPKLPSSLRYLSLSENLMRGPIDSLESLSQLEYLDLSMNQFTGAIPPSLFQSHISSLLLQRNNLSGGVPQPVAPLFRTNDNNNDKNKSDDDYGAANPYLGLYSEGSVVDLSYNFLTGELTGILAGVESVFVNSNRLTGTVPEEYVKRLYDGRTKTLYLQYNYFTGFGSTMTSSAALPSSASFCASYNCMVPPPAALITCPATASQQPSRPSDQCSSNS